MGLGGGVRLSKLAPPSPGPSHKHGGPENLGLSSKLLLFLTMAWVLASPHLTPTKKLSPQCPSCLSSV